MAATLLQKDKKYKVAAVQASPSEPLYLSSGRGSANSLPRRSLLRRARYYSQDGRAHQGSC
jgi:hypothetical protein